MVLDAKEIVHVPLKWQLHLTLRVSDTRVIAATWFDLARSEGLKQAT